MHIDVEITAFADNDPSCNLFSFTEAHRFSIAMPPTAAQLQKLMYENKQKFIDAWPHKGINPPTIISIDLDIRLNDGEES